jgi:lipopolysaccharide export system ATP-binding protein
VTQLIAQNLAKSYKGRPVVKDVSLDIASGQIVGLLGPNGAGKTTCFYMIVGIVPADGGRVSIDGMDITNLSLHERAHAGLGYLPQEASVFRRMSVRDNILAMIETRKDLGSKARQFLCNQLLEEFRLGHVQDTLGQALSGGERRRVEIARALALEPKFVLLDEPFAGVDPISVNDIKAIVRHVAQRNIGVLITDHNVRETLDLCDTAFIVGEGHIIAKGQTEDILGNQRVRDIYLGEHFSL